MQIALHGKSHGRAPVFARYRRTRSANTADLWLSVYTSATAKSSFTGTARPGAKGNIMIGYWRYCCARFRCAFNRRARTIVISACMSRRFQLCSSACAAARSMGDLFRSSSPGLARISTTSTTRLCHLSPLVTPIRRPVSLKWCRRSGTQYRVGFQSSCLILFICRHYKESNRRALLRC